MEMSLYYKNSHKMYDRLEKIYTELVSVVEDLGYTSETDSRNLKDTPARCARAFLEMNLSTEEVSERLKAFLRPRFPCDSPRARPDGILGTTAMDARAADLRCCAG